MVAAAVLVAGWSGNSDNGGQPARSGGQVATADGTQLDGVLVGSGPAGVVLLHQHPGDLCGFWPTPST